MFFSSRGFHKISFSKSHCRVPGILSKRKMWSLRCECVGPCQTLLRDSSPHPSPFPHSHNSPLTHTRHGQTPRYQSHRLFSSAAFFCFCVSLGGNAAWFPYHTISSHLLSSYFPMQICLRKEQPWVEGLAEVTSNEETRRTNTVITVYGFIRQFCISYHSRDVSFSTYWVIFSVYLCA